MERPITKAICLTLLALILALGPSSSESAGQCHPISEHEKASLKGKYLTSSLEDQLSSLSGAAEIRKLDPKTAATMEASERRLNVQVDNDNKILSIWCDLPPRSDYLK